MARSRRFVYILKTRTSPVRYYTGLTSSVSERLAAHNAGHCAHTADNGAWELDVVIAFADERRAARFERYLKSGSGCSFAKRHFR
jgi:putative endonuclease